jgi:hypothetical protein
LEKETSRVSAGSHAGKRRIGFAQRKSLLDYEGYSKEFCNVIKKAITRLEAVREAAILQSKGNPAGAIFWLKNHGWTDQHD